MKAYRMLEWEKPPQLLDVPIPEPDAGQVRLRVGASGACHSDLHLMDWPEGTVGFKLPFTLGHEVAGWVDKLGPGAHGFEVGDKVAVHGPWGCGRCARCRRGEENYCARAAERAAAGVGLGVDGGMAEYLLVPSTRHLVPIGRLDPTEAAPLTDAGLTSYHAVARSRSRLGPGQTAVVIGAGGLGHMAIQILRALTPAFVVALDRDDLQLALAREVGAHLAVNVKDAGDDPATTILEGHRAAVVLDFVGYQGHPGARGEAGGHPGPPDHRRPRRRHPGGGLLRAPLRGERRHHLLGERARADGGHGARRERADPEPRGDASPWRRWTRPIGGCARGRSGAAR